LLVFGGGASFLLDEECLLGRQPEVDGRVWEGTMRPLVVDDSSRLVFRAHLEIMLLGWYIYITDAGAANGALVATLAAPGCSALVACRPLRLPLGARVSIGDRSWSSSRAGAMSPRRGSAGSQRRREPV
jgi:hypothetical protein